MKVRLDERPEEGLGRGASTPCQGEVMRGTFLRLCMIVCARSLLLGAAQAMILDNTLAQTSAAPKPEFKVVSAHDFTPPTLSSTVQVEQDVLYLPAGVCTGFHLHGGPGIETVLSGEVVVLTKATDTTPASSQTFKTGEAYIYPVGVVHNFCNMTTLPASWTSALLLLDGAPPVTPAK